MKPYIEYKDTSLMKRLKDPEEALGYLKVALEDEDKRVFLIALKDVAEVQGGLTKLARAARMSREHLYDMLSRKGNPEFLSLRTLLEALGFQLSLDIKTNRPKMPKAA